jgi:hypothetical protein
MQMVIQSKPSLIKTFILLAVASILHIIITEDYYKYFIKNTFCSSTNWQALPQSCSVPLFIWVILWIVFHITFVDFMQQPCSSFTVYTSITLSKLHTYSLKIYYLTAFHDSILHGINVAPTSLVCVFAMFLLPVTGNWKVWGWSGFQWHNIHTGNQYVSWKLVNWSKLWKELHTEIMDNTS